MRFIILLLFTFTVARADTLSALKERLLALQGPANLVADVTFTKLATTTDKSAPAYLPVSARVSESPEGLSVLLPSSLLASYAEEQRRKNNDANASQIISQSIKELNPLLLWKPFKRDSLSKGTFKRDSLSKSLSKPFKFKRDKPFKFKRDRSKMSRHRSTCLLSLVPCELRESKLRPKTGRRCTTA